jgi:hypothetical protein
MGKVSNVGRGHQMDCREDPCPMQISHLPFAPSPAETNRSFLNDCVDLGAKGSRCSPFSGIFLTLQMAGSVGIGSGEGKADQ